MRSPGIRPSPGATRPAAGTKQATTPAASPACPHPHRPHQGPSHHGPEPAAANPAHGRAPRDGPQRPAVVRPLPQRSYAPARAAGPLRHQAVISRIRSTCQGAATTLHGDASRTSRRLRSGPARRISMNARRGLPCGTGSSQAQEHGRARPGPPCAQCSAPGNALSHSDISPTL